MRVSVLDTETETFESQSQLLRPRLSKVSLIFDTETGKLMMVETETRILTIFEIETTRDQPLNVETESLPDLWPLGEFSTIFRCDSLSTNRPCNSLIN